MLKFSDLDQKERFRTLLASENNDFRNVAMAFCLDLNSYNSASKLGRKYLGLLENSGLKAPNGLCLGSYCSRVFNRFGLTEGEKSWRLTEDGSNYGQPSAALAIKTANDQIISFHEVLGRTNDPAETVGPYRRAMILMQLSKLESASQDDLKKSLRVKGTSIHFHLRSLADAGLIEYESIGRGEPGWSPYRWIKGKGTEQVMPIATYTGLTKRVAELMQEDCNERTCNDLSRELSCSSLVASRILTGLERQNVTMRTGKFKSASKHSEARITKKGSVIAEEFLIPTHDAVDPKNGSSLEDYTETFYAYCDNPELKRNHVVVATQLCLDASPFLNHGSDPVD